MTRLPEQLDGESLLQPARPQKPRGFTLPVISVDRADARPLHRQIYDSFRKSILENSLQPGQQVPSSRALAAELRVSRIPVVDAYAQLLAEGYFEARAGAGTFVSSALHSHAAKRVRDEIGHALQPSGPRVRAQRNAVLTGRARNPWLSGAGAFSIGQLAFEEFPVQMWSKLISRHAHGVRASALNYGDPSGSRELREVLAAYLRTSRAVRCEADQIMIVGGSQQALDLCARVLIDPGAEMWVEEPGYWLMRYPFELAGAQLIPVPVDNEGIRVAEGITRSPNAGIAYVTPSHQYPLGTTMTVSRRLELLEWANRKGAWILEDDYDSDYRYDSTPISSLQGLDEGMRVIYIGTFSKALFPSMRLGYLVLPPDLVEAFRGMRAASDICPPRLHQSVLAEFIERGHFARHVRKMRSVYNERRQTLVEAIRQELGQSAEIMGAEAGMHIVLALPDGLDDEAVAHRAAEQKLWLWPLSTTYLEGKRRRGFVLGFGSVRAIDILPAIQALHGLLRTSPNWS